MSETNIEKINLDVEKELKKEKVLKIVKNVLVYLFLTFMAIFSLFPFVWMILTRKILKHFFF